MKFLHFLGKAALWFLGGFGIVGAIVFMPSLTAVLLLIFSAIILPIDFLKTFWEKLKLKGAIKGVVLAVLFFTAAGVSPTAQEDPALSGEPPASYGESDPDRSRASENSPEGTPEEPLEVPEAPAAAEYTTTPKEALASEPGTAASPSRTPEETPAPEPSASAPETKPTVPVQAPSNPEPAPAAPAQSAPVSSPPPASEELEPPQPVPELSPQVDGTASGGGSGENFNTYNNAEQQNTQDSWVLNTNTMKIHYPSCSQVKKIAPQNYSTSNLSEGELKNQGYSTCGVCH